MHTSTKELFYSCNECDIFFIPHLHSVFSVWKGIFTEGEHLREIFNELIHALEQRKASVIVADAREMKIIPYVDQQWTIEDWYPRAVKAGFRYQGLILSRDTFNEITVKRITQNYDDAKITTQYFTSPEEAFEWALYLHNQERPPYPKQQLS